MAYNFVHEADGRTSPQMVIGTVWVRGMAARMVVPLPGVLAEGVDDDATIVGSYTRAIDAFTALARPFWLAVTRLELGEWLATHGRAAEATEQLTEARTTFDALGAAPWLKRVDAAGAEAPAVATHAHR
jgi:hypothetical protein